MRLYRLAMAVLMVTAFAAYPAVAQVTNSLPDGKKAADAEPVAITSKDDPKVETPPVQVSAVPEPGSILLLAGPAAVGWVAYWRRKWRADPAADIPTSQP